jgi:site-specific DNA-methyltransferase (adenine-specific)
MRDYARQAHFSLKMQNQCCELKIRAERKGGKLLGEMKLRGGDRKSNSHNASLKLDDMGIDKDKSARWQILSQIPEPIFENHIREVVEKEQELTSSGLLMVAREIKSKEKEQERRRRIYDESLTISAETMNIHCADCLNHMKDNMNDESIDLIITSPPYDNLRTFNGFEFKFEEIAKELYRVLKPGCVLIWICGDGTINGTESLTSFKQAIYFKKECGFNVHDTMIFRRVHSSYPSPPSHNRYQQCYDYIFLLARGAVKTFNPLYDIPKKHPEGPWGVTSRRKPDGTLDLKSIGATNNLYKMRDNIWTYHSGAGFGGDDYSKEHPATMPLGLARDLMISFSNPGMLVFDCFMGSGTVGVAAKQLDRRFVRTDISQEYCDLARKRIAAMDGPK